MKKEKFCYTCTRSYRRSVVQYRNMYVPAARMGQPYRGRDCCGDRWSCSYCTVSLSLYRRRQENQSEPEAHRKDCFRYARCIGTRNRNVYDYSVGDDGTRYRCRYCRNHSSPLPYSDVFGHTRIIYASPFLITLLFQVLRFLPLPPPSKKQHFPPRVASESAP